MNDDLKPGLCANGITPQRAFMLAELVAIRIRDRAISEASKLAADVIATQIHDLAKSWEGLDALVVRVPE